MRVLSVNVAQPRPIPLGGGQTFTGIYKEPVPGSVSVHKESLAGDTQADLRVHGGPFKAVYAYPSEHYPYWERELARSGFLPGLFGENLTTAGLLETSVFVGDIFRIGSATLQVTTPRIPCAKLAYKMGRPQFIKEFLQSGRSGFYFRVLEEGQLAAGDPVELIRRDPNKVTVRGLLGLTDLHEEDLALAARAFQVESLPSSWREDLAALLQT